MLYAKVIIFIPGTSADCSMIGVQGTSSQGIPKTYNVEIVTMNKGDGNIEKII